jgi:hypothetical protein
MIDEGRPMAGTVTANVSIKIVSGNLVDQPLPSAFVDSNVNLVNPAKGPVPGALTVPVGGVAVVLSQLVTPGYVWMCNLDPVNFVEFGVYDSVTGAYYPVGILAPGVNGQQFPCFFKLSPNFGHAQKPGTGTYASDACSLYLKAYTAAMQEGATAYAVVKAYES